MSQDFIAALAAEIESIEADLSNDIRFIRLQALKETLALYTDPGNGPAHLNLSTSSIISEGQIYHGSDLRLMKPDITRFTTTRRPTGRRTSSGKIAVLDAVSIMLRNRSGPVPTRDILNHLTDFGIEIGGSSPLNNLSATLSNSDKFKSLGRLGWVLNDTDQDDLVPKNDIGIQHFRKAVESVVHQKSAQELSNILYDFQDKGSFHTDIRSDVLNIFEPNSDFHDRYSKEHLDKIVLREIQSALNEKYSE